MKQIASIIAISLFSAGSLMAQVNTDIQETTTTKKVTMRNDEKITTQVVEETDADVEILEVEGNNNLDQNTTVVKMNRDKKEKVTDANADNTANKAIVAQKQEMRKNEMAASRQAEMDMAAKEKMILEQNKAKMKADLEARKNSLESRPKGMKKLKKKDNDN